MTVRERERETKGGKYEGSILSKKKKERTAATLSDVRK